MAKRRVVITGIGMVTPIGNDVARSWDGVVNGKSGIDLIERFDTQNFNVKFGGEVKDLDVANYLPAKEIRKIDRFIQLGMIASQQACDDAELSNLSDESRERTGVIIGSGIGGLETIEKSHASLLESGPRRISPFFVPGTVINMLSGNVAIKHGFSGPNLGISSACTTGSHSLGYAARTIAYGDADIMLAGGSEASLTPMGLGAFAAARALSSRNDDPKAASRPWDSGRDGFVLGEGAGVLVLEELEHAKERGAKIYAEFVGFGMSDDAFHITSPPDDGAGALRSMQCALNDAGLDASAIDYINAHGTSTIAGDLAECRAIKALCRNGSDTLAVSSTKSMTGHLIGAAGAVEAIYSVLSIKESVVPPTINLDNPAEECDLNFVAHQAQHREVSVAVSNSFGFGGTNASLVFKKY